MNDNNGHFLFIRKFIVLVFAVNIISIILLLSVFITSLNSNNRQVIESKMDNIRVNFENEVILPLNTMAFALRNPFLHDHVQQRNHLELIRWINEYRRATDVDGCLLMSVNGEVLAKTEFFKYPYSDKFAYMVDEVLKGNIVSDLDFFGIDELDEAMRFKISQRVSQQVAIDQEKGKAFMIVRGMPVHDRMGEMIAVFLTTTILNNNSSFISRITHPTINEAVAIISLEEVIAYSAEGSETARDLISRINFEKAREMLQDGSNNFTDRRGRIAYVPLKGHVSENTIGFFAFSYTNHFFRDNFWKFFVFILLFLISTVAICIYYYKYTKMFILKPWDKVISLFSMIESGAKKLPLVTREDKMSPFGDIFKIIYKVSPALKKSTEAESLEEQNEKDVEKDIN